MPCYRNGGCGPYEGRSCTECPASKPGYQNSTLSPSAPLKGKGTKRLWFRAGVTLSLTTEEVEAAFANEGKNASDIIAAALTEGRFVFDGDSYIPGFAIEDYNKAEGTSFPTGDVECELPVCDVMAPIDKAAITKEFFRSFCLNRSCLGICTPDDCDFCSVRYADEMMFPQDNGSKSHVVDAEFHSLWENGVDVKSSCKVNLDTLEVFDIQMVNVEGVDALDSEYIILPNGEKHLVFQKGEQDIGEFWQK